jgi:para-nitrobenzyl esterase
MLITLVFLVILPAARAWSQPAPAVHPVRVTLPEGTLEGSDSAGIISFKGIPYAAPPVGPLRWQAPRPLKPWQGVRSATAFGPRAMQNFVFHDMIFRSPMSEDCLYLNVWTPDNAKGRYLPVLVYFYGGGFVAGDGSEPRYDGESMARQGIVSVTVNYRLGVFGFLALPALARESSHRAAGNYGLLDQHAALQWVHDHIAAFGGDPSKVTIAGESAGSMSVSAQMASPLSRGLFRGVIGESGAVMGNLSPQPLARSEAAGERFMSLAGAGSLAALRTMSADSLLALTLRKDCPRFSPTVDGYFLPRSPEAIFMAGAQMDVPLLAGTNSAEQDYRGILGDQDPTPENYRAAVEKLYGERAAEVLKAFPGATEEVVIRSATALAADRFIAYATWKWMHLQATNGKRPVYRYIFSRILPPLTGSPGGRKAVGAPHAGEIPYALGNLGLIDTRDWTAGDRETSRAMQAYFVNFIRTGNPNGDGLPAWPRLNPRRPAVMILDSIPRARAATDASQYGLMDELMKR